MSHPQGICSRERLEGEQLFKKKKVKDLKSWFGSSQLREGERFVLLPVQ